MSEVTIVSHSGVIVVHYSIIAYAINCCKSNCNQHQSKNYRLACTVLYNFVVLVHPVVGSVHKVWAEYSHNCQLPAGVRCWVPGVSSVLTEVFLCCRASAIGLDWHSRAVSGVMWCTDVVHKGCNVVRIADSWLRLLAISLHVSTLGKLFTDIMPKDVLYLCTCAKHTLPPLHVQ